VEPEPGERVFFIGHPSWRSILGFYVVGFLVAVLAGALAGVVTAIAVGHVEVGWVVLVVAAVLLLLLGGGALRRIGTTYGITDQRLTIQHGIFSREIHQTRLDRVQNVNYRQSLFERLLRVGTVDFDTAGSAEFDFSFRGVAVPERIVRTVDRAIHERSGASVHDPLDGPGPSAPASY
jgi:uncharacterized membrane protein YdbT with pleckstrin-like domain